MVMTFAVADRLIAWRERSAEFPAGEVVTFLREAAARQIKNLREDHGLGQFLRRYKSGDKIQTARDAAGEQKALALGLLCAPEYRPALLPYAPSFHFDVPAPVAAECIATGLAGRVLLATPVLWLDAMRVTAIASSMPRHVTSRDMLPLPSMWFTFEGALQTKHSQSNAPGALMIDSQLIEHSGDGFMVTSFGTLDGRVFVQMGYSPYGQTYPDDCPDMGAFLAMLSFMNSPYVSADPVIPTRAERREILKVQPDYQFPGVKVIRLRSPEPKPYDGTKPETDSGREYSHRWLVRGHHRAQWYPSTQSHKVIWIAPHIKGPADAPFVPPVYAVIR